MVFASVLKVALTGLLATASSPYLSCKWGGWGSDNACDQLVNTVDSFAHSTFTAGQRFIPAWYDPPDPIGQQILQYREDARRWSETTDFVVAPTFDLAQWTTDVIVRPPGDLIVYISPSEFLARLRDLVPPPWTCDPLRPRLSDPTAFDTGMVGIELNYLFDIGDSIPLYTVLAFFALVFGIIDIVITAIHLVPAVRVAWSKMVVDRIPAVLAALEQVGRTIFGALLTVSSPILDDIQHIAADALYFVHSMHRAWSTVVVSRVQAVLSALGQVKHIMVNSLVISLASVLDDMPHIVITAISLVPAARVAWNTMVVTRISAIPGQVGRHIFGSLLECSSPTLDDVKRIFGGDEVTIPLNRRLRRSLKFAAPRIIRDHALMASPRPAFALDLANWTPVPKSELRSLLIIFQDGPVPTPLALKRSATRLRTFSAMTFMEAKPAPTSGPLTMSLLVEEEAPWNERTLAGDKCTLRRQAPGIELFGLWKRRVRRHQELRTLRDEMGMENALRHAQEGHAILRAGLRSMMGMGEQLPGQHGN